MLGRVPTLALTALASTAVVLTAASPILADTLIVVSPASMGNWFAYEEIPNGSVAFVTGPETPPLGDGSAEFSVDATGRVILATPDHAGTRFDEITSLDYSTYQPVDENVSDLLATSLQLDVDYDLTDMDTSWQGRLVYEPYQNGTVFQGMWQEWMTMDGEWWASGSPGNMVCPQSDPCTVSELLTAFPNLGIRADVGNLNLKAGGPWAPSFLGYVDALKVGINEDVTTYNFEPGEASPTPSPSPSPTVSPSPSPTVSPSPSPSPIPLTKDECKDGGWMIFGYSNQGQCVAFVASEGKAGGKN